MYQIELRRQAYKDLESIPTDYARLIARHIDALDRTRVLMTQKSSKVTRGFRYVSVHIVFFMISTIRRKSY